MPAIQERHLQLLALHDLLVGRIPLVPLGLRHLRAGIAPLLAQLLDGAFPPHVAALLRSDLRVLRNPFAQHRLVRSEAALEVRRVDVADVVLAELRVVPPREHRPALPVSNDASTHDARARCARVIECVLALGQIGSRRVDLDL